MTLFHYLSIAGLIFGSYAGLLAILSPGRIASSLGLRADTRKPGGYAEFRSTFGGVFFMIHATAIALMFMLAPDTSTYVIMPIAAAWYGAAICRLLSMALDKEENGEGGINRYWVVLELIVGSAIAAPALTLL